MKAVAACPPSLCVPKLAAQRQRRQRCTLRTYSQADGDPNLHDGNDGSPTQPPLPQASRSSSPPNPITNPSGLVVYGGRLPPARRLIISGISATAVALGGNLFGVTSWLLSLDGGKLAASSHLDILVPVNGFRRCYDPQNGFTFLYPSRWLADQTLYRRYAERIERQAALDPPPLGRRLPRRGGAPEPSAAYGPAGSTGEENVSVIVAPIRDGFTLQKLGRPEEAAQRFLDTTVAPEGSGLTATLLGAGSRRDDSGDLYYWQEFTVRSERFYRHNLSVYAARNGLLYTLNCQCPEPRWREQEGSFRTVANSFAILNSGAAQAPFPDRL